MELIDKSAIVAEIKRIEEQNPHIQHGDMLVNRDRSIRCNLLEDLLDFINTLEVKEVDLEKLIDDYMLPITAQDVKEEPFTQLEKCAKHFFELGIKQSKNDNNDENKN